MPIFQFRCSECFSIFEHLQQIGGNSSCVSCGSSNVSRVTQELMLDAIDCSKCPKTSKGSANYQFSKL